LQQTPVAKWGETLQEITTNFAYKYPCSYLWGSLTSYGMGGDGFTFPLMEVMLQIFITLKNPLL
jgi:hypothetical protein